jgi:hypothetical protein
LRLSWDMMQRVISLKDVWLFYASRLKFVTLYKGALTAAQQAELAAFIEARPRLAWRARQKRHATVPVASSVSAETRAGYIPFPAPFLERKIVSSQETAVRTHGTFQDRHRCHGGNATRGVCGPPAPHLAGSVRTWQARTAKVAETSHRALPSPNGPTPNWPGA